jgi:hypothetical protein
VRHRRRHLRGSSSGIDGVVVVVIVVVAGRAPVGPAIAFVVRFLRGHDDFLLPGIIFLQK